jgi:spermidine synthase
VLILGGAGYTVPQHLLNWPSQPDVTVVEIDPGMTRLAKKYFRLRDHDRLDIKHEDARIFLQDSTEKYDVVMIDVFSNSYGIPFHILTKESMEQLKNRLSDNGVIVTNVIGSPEGKSNRLVGSVVQTFKTQFKEVTLFSTDRSKPDTVQNVIVLATNASLDKNTLHLSAYLENYFPYSSLSGLVLTDDYSPMEAMARAQLR